MKKLNIDFKKFPWGKIQEVLIVITAFYSLYVFYPGLASLFYKSEEMNALQVLWNVLLCFSIFNIALVVLILVIRLLRKLNKWLDD